MNSVSRIRQLRLSNANGGNGFALYRVRDYGIVVALAALFIFLSLSSSVFLTKVNMLNILDQWSPVGIMAVGGALVLITGGLDLSVGAIFTLSAIVAARVINAEGLLIGVLAGLGVGVVTGVVNGLLVTVGRINAFIATITSGIIIGGIALKATGGYLVTVTNTSLSDLGTREVLTIKVSIYLWLVVAIIGTVLLAKTFFGRYVYAVGANPEAARLSGVRVGLVRTSVFAASGVAGAIAGIIVLSRTGTAGPSIGSNVTFDVIAAMLLGGISVQGGSGSIWRAVVGVLLLALIDNGMNLHGVDPSYQQVIEGTIILGAIAFDAWARKTHV